MKKTLSLLLSLMVFTWVGAQVDHEKDLKKVSRNIANYNLDPVTNADALTESVALIEGVVNDPAFEKDGKAWLLYGNVYGEIVNGMTQALVLDPNAEITSHEAVVNALKGYKNAISFAVKSYDKKDAVTGLKGSLPNMSYVANTILNRQEYEYAYPAYAAVVEGEGLIEDNGEEGIFSDEDLQSTRFVTAYCAFNSGRMDESLLILNSLKDENYSDAGVYEFIVKAYKELERLELSKTSSNDNPIIVDTIRAITFSNYADSLLAEGLEKFPNDKGLLFVKINIRLAQGRGEELIDELKKAHELEPENASVAAILGSIYEQLFQNELRAGGKIQYSSSSREFIEGPKGGCYYVTEAGSKVYVSRQCCANGCASNDISNENAVNAIHWMNLAIEIDPKYFDAIYTLGAFHYNAAVHISIELNELAADYSKEGTKRYDAKTTEMMAQFDKSLPYFEMAESINPNDLNTLSALREIWARKGNIPKSEEYKAKFDRINGN